MGDGKVKLKKGDRVTITGYGRTQFWPKITVGTVTKRRGTQVYVQWDKTSFEDQMDMKEVKLLEQKQ